ncbi:CBP80/20-dependent translation initiation factor [Tribolium madens]|uniref:CBP80/20-dependent translation initiation factor n=1 Tax=Tribolium madens TaxID=41895 RepID=UPI001CF75090|nr:CBP80/20-dependent translation initiation factor [Tribolium madens]
MSCGAGRGRGWLNLGSNVEPPKPMGLPQPLAPSPVEVSPEYRALVDRVKELNVNDDGILLNKKVKHIQNFWQDECHSQEEVEASFDQLYNAALHDSELASKLVTLVSLRCTDFQTHDCNIRYEFLKRLQRDFKNSNQLQTTNPSVFRNCMLIIGEFFSKARLSDGEPYKFLSTPFFTCLELLLDGKTLPDLILFTKQLHLNGSTLRSRVPDDFTKLTVKIRTLLAEPQLVKEARLWLLLALDLCNVRFGVLPNEIFKFYEDQLGIVPMVNFQRPHDPLSIQTLHSSKVLDSYQSNVNVLQISTSPTEPPNDVQQYGNTEYNGTQQKKEKPGRPILGVGARFINKNKDENGSWNNKKSSSGRAPKKTPPDFKNKGWEHDDRFENDYS